MTQIMEIDGNKIPLSEYFRHKYVEYGFWYYADEKGIPSSLIVCPTISHI